MSENSPKSLKDIRRDFFLKKSQEHNPKNILTDETYLKRRAERLRRDKELALRKHDEIIKHNLALWQNSISTLWKDASLDDEKMAENHKEFVRLHADRWNDDPAVRRHTSIMLTGFAGRGKTWTSYAYMHEIIRRGAVTPQQIVILAESRLATIAKSGFERAAKMSELLDPKNKVFFVDEVGRGAFTNDVDRGSIWFELMDHIYSNQLCLIITSNLTKDDIPNWFGGATTDRLRALIGSDGFLPFVDEKNMRQELGQYSKGRARQTNR